MNGVEYYQIPNWTDTVVNHPSERHMGDGGVGQYPIGGWKGGLHYPVAGGDWFLFTLRGSGQNPPNSTSIPQQHQPIIMADPSVMRIDHDDGETWYYITGTSGAVDVNTRYQNAPVSDSNAEELAILGTQQANFVIYRTKDFYHFEPHMTAFDEMSRNLRVLQLASKTYADMKSPHLYFDPVTQRVYITFSAIESPGVPAGGFVEAVRLLNDSSIFLVSMSRSDFLSWHDKNWYSNRTGARFSDNPSWYAYYDQTGWHFDGGWVIGKYVPASGDPFVLDGANAGQLEWRTTTNIPAPSVMGRGWGHRAWASHTFMADGPYVFFDPLASSENTRPPWWVLYDWNDAYGMTQDVWGNAVAAHPLGGDHNVFDHGSDTHFVENNRSTHNRILGPDGITRDNGTVDKLQKSWYWGGVAESSAAAYLPASDMYYLFFSRNTWDSSAYQIVYRKTPKSEIGGAFSQFGLGRATKYYAIEYLLLRSDRYTQPAADGASQAAASFGSPSIFTMISSDGDVQQCMAFHAKFETSARRTTFFKELHVTDTTTGALRQLNENSAGCTTAACKQTGINVFRRFKCIP